MVGLVGKHEGAYDLGRALPTPEAERLLQRRVEPLDFRVYSHGHHVEARQWCGVVRSSSTWCETVQRAEPERNPMGRILL